MKDREAGDVSPSAAVGRVARGCYDWFSPDGKGRGDFPDRPLSMENPLGGARFLFEPIRINALDVPNRVVMGPMGNVGMAEPGGRPGERMAAYYAERARGGVGLVVSGMTPVDVRLDPSYAERNGSSMFPSLGGSRARFPGWKAVAEEVRAAGARFFVQLAPGMGRVGSPECLPAKGKLPVSSSWNPNWYLPELPCRRLSDSEIRRIVKATGKAALDLREIGVDGVQIHGHSGYLVEQMTDGAFNRRRIGRYRHPARFGLDLVESIRGYCGKRFPVVYRLDLSLALRETWGERMESERDLSRFRSGRTAEETLDFIEALVEAGVDAIEVDLGGYESWWLPHPPNGMPPAPYLEMASLVKARLGGRLSAVGVPVPVILTGKMGFPSVAERVIADGVCDMVTLARSLLADPEWPLKVREGRAKDIRPCIGDHEGCLGQLMTGGSPHCAVNPDATFEYRPRPQRPARAKRVAVVGAGPAGLSAAFEAADLGHSVVLYEAADRVGGMLVPGSRPGVKYEVRNYLDWLGRELAKRSGSIQTRLGTQADGTTLRSDGPWDCVVVAAGAIPVIPPLNAASGTRTVTAVDLLSRPETLGAAKDVVIVGGSDVGCETASWLALELGVRVSIVEMLPHLMPRSCHSNRGYMIRQLELAGVTVLANAKLSGIGAGRVAVEALEGTGLGNPFAVWRPLLPANIPNPLARKPKTHLVMKEIPADLVVFACGMRSRFGVGAEIARALPDTRVTVIGDSLSPGRVLEAVRAGRDAGRNA